MLVAHKVRQTQISEINMMHRTRNILILLLVCTSVAPLSADEPEQKEFKLDRNAFQVGYSAGFTLSRSDYGAKGFVVRILKEGKEQNRRKDVQLQVQEILNSKPLDKPIETSINLYARGNQGKVPKPSDKLYLVLARPQNRASDADIAKNKWMPIVSNMPFMPLETLEDRKLVILEKLVLEKERQKNRQKQVDLLFEALESKDSFLIGLGSAVAGNNATYGLIDSRKDDSADRLARYLLKATDPTQKTYISRMYYSSGAANPIPKDPDLVLQLIKTDDTRLRSYFLRALTGRADQAKRLAPTITKYLLGEDLNASGCHALLTYIKSWADAVEPIEPAIEKVARGQAGQTDAKVRAIALDFLAQRPKTPQRDDLVVDLATQTDLATASYHAARLSLPRAVGQSIQAVRDKQISWDGNTQRMCQLITGRTDLQSWQQWNQWWSQVQQQGNVEAFAADGFADDSTNRQVEQLVDDLISPQFVVRARARSKLGSLPLHPEIPSIRQALLSANPEVRQSVLALLKRQADNHQHLLKQLEGARNTEISVNHRNIRRR